jgi:hypothetical protein
MSDMHRYRHVVTMMMSDVTPSVLDPLFHLRHPTMMSNLNPEASTSLVLPVSALFPRSVSLDVLLVSVRPLSQ